MSASDRAPLLALGDLAWDVLAKPDTLLLPGGDTTGQLELSGGGSAANLAVWSARVGYPTGFSGKIGQDRFGQLAVLDLEAEGVTPHIVTTDEHPTGVILALIDHTGQRAMLSGQGADWYLQPWELPTEALQTARHVHLTAWSLFSDPPRGAALHAAQLAKAAGATVSLDPGSFQMIQQFGRDSFLHLMDQIPFDLLLPNADEARAISGESEPHAMLGWLRERFAQAEVALKLDAQGALLGLREGAPIHVPATRDHVIDATGAGDAFGGAYLGHLLRFGDPLAAARCATDVAGWVVSRFGARAPIDEDLRGRLARHEMVAQGSHAKPEWRE
ncbi:carbohydrate kinase family protein [Deinococcus peraridilitoris]|uniref:Sugar kinase, ribokinase n=1 Tax=Deinococcus peraridilitoris (strain DSM 19664 / LMG 22246 / CIP 109416 / KR-200) TaxID=937777 RepID=L0A0I7_DEIPD|nr:sugar kinase [Deinococcus peraridilitoris]AFZ67361.1 sugar kinase, ribokinase [Deinococcus peraridilitoris DSM 19664]